MKNIIDIQNLNFEYAAGSVKIPIFKSFNLSVQKGEFVAIKGASGSGKSTLLYLIAGLLKFSQGKILLHDRNIGLLSDLELSLLRNKHLGFVFQQFHLLPKSSVLDNILLPTFYPVESKKIHVGGAKKARDLAIDLGIGDRLEHRPNQLSGGQQQRVSIARALINEPDVILADEPTGNLDSKSTEHIIEILKKLHAQGKTIVLITHENDVAKHATKIVTLKDGEIISTTANDSAPLPPPPIEDSTPFEKSSRLSQYIKIFPISFQNAFRNKTRSFLTMLGIMVGVASVCAMVTLGKFTKEKIMDSYAKLGVNTILFRGRPNWQIKASDQYPITFRFFNWEKELVPLRNIFPEIELISPTMTVWASAVTYAGQVIERESLLVGVSKDGPRIMERNVIAGKTITTHHVERRQPVCLIGYEVGERLFNNTSPVGKIMHVAQRTGAFACKVIGILEPLESNKGWARPNLQIFIPFTLFDRVSDNWWHSQIKRVVIQVREGTDVVKISKSIQKFFESKYGKSGRFRISSDTILVAQMEKFLNLFAVLLTVIALVSLLVGGMGITNMMLATVSERFREIGIRKSLGATNLSIRNQFLLESIFLCAVAGLTGILCSIVVYQSAIYGAAKLIKKLQFEWVFDPLAISISLLSILLVGILSGIVPAIKAQKLQVIEALRSE